MRTGYSSSHPKAETIPKGGINVGGFTGNVVVSCKMYCDKHGIESIDQLDRKKLFDTEYERLTCYLTTGLCWHFGKIYDRKTGQSI